MNYGIHEVDALKTQSKSDIDKVLSDYRIWVSKIRLVNNATLYFVLYVSIGTIIALKDVGHTIILFLLGFIAIRSGIELAEREGHEEGYLYGFHDGLDAGVNKTLGIENESEQFAAEVLLDNQLHKDIHDQKEFSERNFTK